MNIGLYTLTSPLHDPKSVEEASRSFISEIEQKAKIRFDIKGEDFGTYGEHDLDIIYVRTGGTEGLFKEVFPTLHGKIVLLTSGRSNSLAASMEILSYLNQHGRKGEIIHGSTGYIAERLLILSKVASAAMNLSGTNLGVIGKPSDWLISSEANKEMLKDKLGINLVEIPISELISEIYDSSHFGSMMMASDHVKRVMQNFGAHAPEFLKKRSEVSLRIYFALSNLICRYNLKGLTIRCFDLLDQVNNTGCLALALLNTEGIPASCEGDVPALVSMAIGNALTQQCGFQANPSRLDPEQGEIVLAHCTVPFDMLRSYEFDSHFESGKGIAIKGELPEGNATIFKIAGDLSRSFCHEAELKCNLDEESLCRTQIMVKLEGDGNSICRDYFLNDPIGNHHIVFTGRHKDLFEAFFHHISAS